MFYPTLIALIILESVCHCTELSSCSRPNNWNVLVSSGYPRFPNIPEPPRPEPYKPYKHCGEPCHGLPPKIDSVAYSPIVLQNVLENVELVCEPTHGSRIVRILVQNNHLQYNATCNGVLAGYEHNPGTIYLASILTKDGEETVVPLKATGYNYVANYNMGTESFNENAELKNCICDGSKLSSYSVWVADDPTQGCCTTGVRKTRAVYYKLEIRGPHCCVSCRLLAATDSYDAPLRN